MLFQNFTYTNTSTQIYENKSLTIFTRYVLGYSSNNAFFIEQIQIVPTI